MAYVFAHHATSAPTRPMLIRLQHPEEGVGGHEGALLEPARPSVGVTSWRRWRKCSATCSSHMNVGHTEDLVARHAEAEGSTGAAAAALARMLTRAA